MFASRQAARAAGWFSRRHETDEAHKAAQAQRKEKQAEKMARAKAQNEATKLFNEERKANLQSLQPKKIGRTKEEGLTRTKARAQEKKRARNITSKES